MGDRIVRIIAEALAAFVPKSHWKNEAESRLHVIKEIAGWMDKPTDTYVKDFLKSPEKFGLKADFDFLLSYETGGKMTVKDTSLMTIKQAMTILSALGRGVTDDESLGIAPIVVLIISIAKRGAVTHTWLSKLIGSFGTTGNL